MTKGFRLLDIVLSRAALVSLREELEKKLRAEERLEQERARRRSCTGLYVSPPSPIHPLANAPATAANGSSAPRTSSRKTSCRPRSCSLLRRISRTTPCVRAQLGHCDSFSPRHLRAHELDQDLLQVVERARETEKGGRTAGGTSGGT